MSRLTEREKNLLDSCANWLSTRSESCWAEEFGYTRLMKEYAEGLREILASPEKPEERPVELADLFPSRRA